MRVVVWGTYDVGKPRTRILLAGLQAAGVEIEQIHSDIWRGVEDKSQLTALRRMGFALRWLFAYPVLIFRYFRCAKHDAVLVPYLGQLDVLVLWPLTRLRRVPVVWDMFISLYDTVVQDRALASAKGLLGRLLWLLEWCGCRAADLVLMDTGPHARSVESQFALLPGQVGWVPVGVEPSAFPRQAARSPHKVPVRILFYGQMIPLHGISTILAAAADPRGQAWHWQLIGTGQQAHKIAEFIDHGAADNVSWQEWVAYDDLQAHLGANDICLGIFGDSDKAAAVVPNKVYQAISAGRSVVTRASPAMDDLLQGDVQGIHLVPAGDPKAILDAIEALQQDGFPQPSIAVSERIQPDRIGQQLRQMISDLLMRQQN